MKANYAIIGGTGVYTSGAMDNPQSHIIHTPYGAAEVILGSLEGKSIAFMARHGGQHGIPPHKINYRANLYALKELGVEQVLATGAVGSIDPSLAPGDLVLVDDVIDMTKSRVNTFFDDSTVVHVDMSDPYCARMRTKLRDVASNMGYALRDGGTYVCTEGPRFETKAEIAMYSKLGGHVVGMTSMPEAVLAKEMELCYATVCMVTNAAAGISKEPLTVEEVTQTMRANVDKLRNLFFAYITSDQGVRSCACHAAVSGQVPLKEEATK